MFSGINGKWFICEQLTSSYNCWDVSCTSPLGLRTTPLLRESLWELNRDTFCSFLKSWLDSTHHLLKVCIFWNRCYTLVVPTSEKDQWCEVRWSWEWESWIILLWSGSMMSQNPANLNGLLNHIFSDSGCDVPCQSFSLGVDRRHPIT